MNRALSETADPVVQLVRGAVRHEVDANDNPYLTLETVVQRLYRKIAGLTRVQPHANDRTVLFARWHGEILALYETLRPVLSQDERVCVERVLSKDAPHTSELVKFACCWLKHDPGAARRLFAVDGLLGAHPRLYVQEAFAPRYARHCDAVRALYDRGLADPEDVAAVVRRAFREAEHGPCSPERDPEFEAHVRAYAEAAGEEEARRVAEECRLKQQQPQPCKRKKVPAPSGAPAAD